MGFVIANGDFRFGLQFPGENDASAVAGDKDGASLLIKGLAVGANSEHFDGEAERNSVAAPIEIQILVQFTLPSETCAKPGE